MTLTIRKVGNKFAVHKAAPNGLPVGEPIQMCDTLDAAQAVAGASAKCWEEEYLYVPWSATTLQEALEAQAAQERAEEVQKVARTYKLLVDRVLDNPDVKSKGKAILQLAQDFAAWLNDMPADEQKAAPAIASVDHSVIKSISGDRIGGYAVVWGDETKRDLTKQYFTPKTAELTAIFDAVGRLPWMYHHALDGTVKTKVSGVVDVLKPDSVGLWYEAQLKMADEYDEAIKKLLAAGRLKTSSQTFASALEYNEQTGEITRWPIVEITGTPTPAEYRMPAIEMLKSSFAAVGINDFDQVMHLTQRDGSSQQGAEKARLELALARLQLS